jgi:hypothetical protein
MVVLKGLGARLSLSGISTAAFIAPSWKQG